MQTAINKTLSELFVQGFDLSKKMPITIDDDKFHFGSNSMAKSDNLKLTKHVCDNKNGYIAHTAVRSASCAPAGFALECRDGDTSCHATERLFRQQFEPTNQIGCAPNLRHILVAADCGYWSEHFMYQFVVKSGAEIISTQK
jgi:hypothetical protein